MEIRDLFIIIYTKINDFLIFTDFQVLEIRRILISVLSQFLARVREIRNPGLRGPCNFGRDDVSNKNKWEV
jgi:hypothetical protein